MQQTSADDVKMFEEDRILIFFLNLYEFKGYGAKRLMKYFPKKNNRREVIWTIF